MKKYKNKNKNDYKWVSLLDEDIDDIFAGEEVTSLYRNIMYNKELSE